MIQVTRRTARKGMDSPMKLRTADISAFAALGAGGWSLWPMTFTQDRTPASRARKMSRLQPARRPSLPIKILRRAGDCGVGIGSAGVSLASSLKEDSSCGGVGELIIIRHARQQRGRTGFVNSLGNFSRLQPKLHSSTALSTNSLSNSLCWNESQVEDGGCFCNSFI